MAYQVGSECYPDMTTALDAFAAQETGHIYNSGTLAYNVVAARSGTTSIKYDGIKLTGTGANWTFTQAITFPTCQKLTEQDGVTVGWLIFSVFLAAYAIKMIRRGL